MSVLSREKSFVFKLLLLAQIHDILSSADFSRRVHIMDDEHYFVSFHTNMRPTPPGPRQSLLRFPEQCYLAPRWFDERYPFLPFCILRPDWTGRLFEPLEGTKNSFPISTVFGMRFELDKELQQHWWDLERALVYAYEEFLGLRPTFLHPLDIQTFRLPSSWGFTVSHESLEAARIRALNSRNAFVPLMALLIYFIALTSKPSTNPYEFETYWIQHLVEFRGVDAEWVNCLGQSVYCAHSVPRIGVYIDWETFNFPHLIPLYFKYHIPVWIRVSKAIHKKASLPRSLCLRSADLPSRITPGPSIQLPVRPPNTPPSRQRPDERIRDFINRMIRENGRRTAQETEEDKVKRLDRERNASRYSCPGARGAYVFHWLVYQGHSIRTYVPRHEVPDLWASHASTQKWYDSVHDEWDVSSELDPGADVDDDDYEDSDTWDRPLSGDVYAPQSDVSIFSLPDLARMRLQQVYDPTVITTFAVDTPDLEDLLYVRYGFAPDGSPYIPPEKTLDELRVARILRNDRFPTMAHRQEATHFFSFIVSKTEVPASLYDLNDNNSIPLRQFMSRAFTCSIESPDRYVIMEREHRENAIQVQYASLVVEAFRTAMWTSIKHLSVHFLLRGTSFHPCRTLEDPFRAQAGSHSGLGFRPKNYKPTLHDFKAYLDRRDQLLLDPSVVRAALLHGGIIWRLAVDSLFFINRGGIDWDAILFHESEAVTLSQQDLGVIVGMYTVWTGKLISLTFNETQFLTQHFTGEANVDKELSWWPQHAQWKQSNADVLYWSQSCESWYQNRLKGIIGNTLDVRSGRQWRQALNLFSQTAKIMEANEANSQRFLRSLTDL